MSAAAIELTLDEEAALDDLEWLASGPHSTKAIAGRLGFSISHVQNIMACALVKLRKRTPGGRTAW